MLCSCTGGICGVILICLIIRKSYTGDGLVMVVVVSDCFARVKRPQSCHMVGGGCH